MANTTKILEALSAYKGDTDSLNHFASVAESELGSEWTGSIYKALPNLPASLKEKLDHAFNYFGAMASWNETQEYLTQIAPLNIQEISDRIPTLEYWLKFFGDAGSTVIRQLEEKINAQSVLEQELQENSENYAHNLLSEETVFEENQQSEDYPLEDSFYEQGVDETYQQTLNEPFSEEQETSYLENQSDESAYQPQEPFYDEPQLSENDDFISIEEETYESIPEQDQTRETQNNFTENEALDEETIRDMQTQEGWKNPVYIPQKVDTNEQFMAKKTFHQLDFVNAVHAWINARCISLGNIEIYAYRYYGFLVDSMEETKKDIQEVLSNPAYYPAVEETRKDGLKTLQNSLLSLEKDLKIAYDNAQTDMTPLIAEDLNPKTAKNVLGGLDTTTQKEYLGPAPDGFEIIDDPYKEQSEGDDAQSARGTKNIHTKVKSTSQTTQNSVQRKISFAFNKKNPSGTV